MRFSAAARRQAPRGPRTAEKSRQGAVSAGLDHLFGVPALLEALPGVRLALRRVLRLGAHFVAHAVAPRITLLGLAGLACLGHRGLHPGGVLLAGLRVLRLRAVEMATLALALHVALRSLGVKAGAGRQKRGAGEHGKFHDRCHQASCFNMVPASETSNLPGPSTLSCFTTPLSTSIEKRCILVPIPRALRSSSRPSALVHWPLPSARKR